MCFNFEASALTFLTSWSISIYLLCKGITQEQRHLVIALMLFSAMQVPDAILWYTEMKKDNINYWVTSFLIPLILCLQIIYNVFVINKSSNIWMLILVFFYILYVFVRFKGYSKPLCCNKLTSPIWASKELKIWELVTFIIISLYPRWDTIGATIFIVLPIIHLVAGGAYGSLWCFVSNLVSLYYLYKF